MIKLISTGKGKIHPAKINEDGSAYISLCGRTFKTGEATFWIKQGSIFNDWLSNIGKTDYCTHRACKEFMSMAQSVGAVEKQAEA